MATAQDGGAKPSAGPSASASDDPDAPLKFARACGSNGLTWFPDPVRRAAARSGPPKGATKKVDAAREACKQFAAATAATRPSPTPRIIEQARQMAKCMRENGVPNFPDPQPDGGLTIDRDKLGTGPEDPTFEKAERPGEVRPERPRHVERPRAVDGGRRPGHEHDRSGDGQERLPPEARHERATDGAAWSPGC